MGCDGEARQAFIDYLERSCISEFSGFLLFKELSRKLKERSPLLAEIFQLMARDEARHGDIFKALLRSQPQLWKTWKARLWSRFFLLSVFATHTMTVHERTGFYKSLGLNATESDRQVVENTNETAGRAFPVMLNTAHPQFFPSLQRCAAYNMQISEIERSSQPKHVKLIRKLPLIAAIVWNLLLVYLIKPINTEILRETVR
ncbi:hypothetical protein NIES2111_04360 [Nostoc sp. NIES-2111]|nr:hypothetical protein NIES2111_04360 [Nostoc sp. NIES-2111]